MFKQVETDKEVWWGGVAVLKPLATFENEHGEKAHWVRDVDREFYVLLAESNVAHAKDCYTQTPYIFPAAANVLADLINHERWSRASVV